MKIFFRKPDLKSFCKKVKEKFKEKGKNKFILLLYIFITISVLLFLSFIVSQFQVIKDFNELVESRNIQCNEEKEAIEQELCQEVYDELEPFFTSSKFRENILQEKEYEGEPYFALTENTAYSAHSTQKIEELDIPESFKEKISHWYNSPYDRVYVIAQLDDEGNFMVSAVSTFKADIYRGIEANHTLFDIYDNIIYVTNYFTKTIDLYQIMNDSYNSINYLESVKIPDSYVLPSSEFLEISCNKNGICNIQTAWSYDGGGSTFDFNTKTKKFSNIVIQMAS